jgi:hypothetical protein
MKKIMHRKPSINYSTNTYPNLKIIPRIRGIILIGCLTYDSIYGVQSLASVSALVSPVATPPNKG